MTYLHCQIEKDNVVSYIIIPAPCTLDSYN